MAISRSILGFVFLLSTSVPLSAQWLHYPAPGIPRTADGKPNLTAPPPRTADGKPDLTGLWNMRNNYVADLKPGEAQPWVQTLVQKRAEDFNKDDPRYQCLPDGPAYSTRGGMQRIVQT